MSSRGRLPQILLLVTAPRAPARAVEHDPRSGACIISTQQIQNFLQDCTTVTADGSLATLDEVEGLYVHWCSLRGQDMSAEPLVPELIALDGVVGVMHNGVDCVEGIVLTGPVVADFILTCEFAGDWGHAGPVEFEAFAQVASAS